MNSRIPVERNVVSITELTILPGGTLDILEFFWKFEKLLIFFLCFLRRDTHVTAVSRTAVHLVT